MRKGQSQVGEKERLMLEELEPVGKNLFFIRWEMKRHCRSLNGTIK